MRKSRLAVSRGLKIYSVKSEARKFSRGHTEIETNVQTTGGRDVKGRKKTRSTERGLGNLVSGHFDPQRKLTRNLINSLSIPTDDPLYSGTPYLNLSNKKFRGKREVIPGNINVVRGFKGLQRKLREFQSLKDLGGQ